MPDSMTFRAREAQTRCDLCAAHPAIFDFEIRCSREKTLQHGACCSTCANNLLNALANLAREEEKPNLIVVH